MGPEGSSLRVREEGSKMSVLAVVRRGSLVLLVVAMASLLFVF